MVWNFIDDLTKSHPELKSLVAQTYFGLTKQQRTLLMRLAKEGYEIFDFATDGSIYRERSIAKQKAKRLGYDPNDIHEINTEHITLWFGKRK